MKDYFEYEVRWWDDEDSTERIFQGVTYGSTFHEALDNILEFYGEKNIISVRMEPWDASGCLEISKDALESIKREE